MTELIEHKSWWKQNWKRFITIVIILLLILGLISSLQIGETVSNTFKVYADPALTEKALEIAKENDEVQEYLGILEPIDKLAIMEGRVEYSNNNSSVDLSFRVNGSKGSGRIRIIADRNGDLWQYKNLSIGIKKLKKTIQIIVPTE